MGIKPDPEYEAELRRKGHGILDRADAAIRNIQPYLDEEEKENVPNNAAMVQFIENQTNNNEDWSRQPVFKKTGYETGFSILISKFRQVNGQAFFKDDF